MLMKHPNRFEGVKFTPNGARVLVRLDAVEDKTKGGIYIPAEAQIVPKWGTVTVVGPEVTIPVKIGSRVFFERTAGENLSIDGVEMLVIHEDDIIGAET